MKKTLKVDINNSKSSYEILITDESVCSLKEEINSLIKDKTSLFVVSKKVYKLYKDILCLQDYNVFILNDGEKEKNYKNYLKIIQKAISLNMTRKDIFIALGGGVTGDITGFVASTYMRGVSFIQIPTTLLSMVDASVGGKTGLDLEYGKNLIGTFWQPEKVLININFLATLDPKQYKSGLGEILKYAFIEKTCKCKQDLFFFEYLTLCADKLLARDMITLGRIIEDCLLLKIAVVKEDEKERGLRKILNFGHTLGHAIETITRYKKYTHGEAVICGIYFVLNYAYDRNLIEYSYYRMSLDLLEKYGYEEFKSDKKVNLQDLIAIMHHDKKSIKDKILFIVPSGKKEVKEVLLTEEDLLI